MRVLILLGLLLLMSCETETESLQENNALTGDWEWIKTYGSIAGLTWTPETTGYTMKLNVDDTYLTFSRNDTVTAMTKYEVFETDTMFRDGISRSFINYDNRTRWFEISNDSLVIRDLCYDCYDDFFIRK